MSRSSQVCCCSRILWAASFGIWIPIFASNTSIQTGAMFCEEKDICAISNLYKYPLNFKFVQFLGDCFLQLLSKLGQNSTKLSCNCFNKVFHVSDHTPPWHLPGGWMEGGSGSRLPPSLSYRHQVGFVALMGNFPYILPWSTFTEVSKCGSSWISPFMGHAHNIRLLQMLWHTPQSVPMLCCPTSWMLIWISSDDFMFRRPAIYFLVNTVTAECILSHKCTSFSLEHPILLTQIQWQLPVWRIWIKSPSIISNWPTTPRVVGWKPLMCGNCSCIRFCTVPICMSVSKPFLVIRLSSLASTWYLGSLLNSHWLPPPWCSFSAFHRHTTYQALLPLPPLVFSKEMLLCHLLFRAGNEHFCILTSSML